MTDTITLQRAEAKELLRALRTFQAGAMIKAEEMLIAAIAQQAVPAWLPIESAPKFKEVLVWRDDSGPFYEWRPIYAAPQAVPADGMADAYTGAREDLAIWKRRALEAEELNRKFAREVNGTTFMGEPAPQAFPAGFVLVPVEPTQEMIESYLQNIGKFQSAKSDWAAFLAAAPKGVV